MKSKVFWISRDQNNENGDDSLVYVWRYRDRPKLVGGAWSPCKSGDYDLCYRGFKALTGLTVKRGEKIKVRMVAGER